MDKTIRRVTDLKEQQAETYRYWQSRTLGERLSAVCEQSLIAYAFKGIQPHVQGLRGSFVRIERPPR